ncbi:MAG: CsgG/HfaB family protein [Pseudomonadota bacterium]
METRKTMILQGILLALILIYTGCATKIKTTMLTPAKSHEASTLKRIAVLPFSGRGDRNLNADIEALLVKIRVNGKPYFSVVERSAIWKIMREQSLHLSGAVDQKTAVKVGRLVGAEGVILGTVARNITEDGRYSETRSKCVSKDKDGKCKEKRRYSVSCTQRDAYFSFIPKVVNVATGEIVASDALTGYSTDRACRDSGQPLRGREEMLAEAKSQALSKFRLIMAPYHVSVEIVLLDDDDTNPPDAAEDRIKRGIEWAEAGRLDRACELWHEAYDIHPQGYAIPYLLGVCAEMAGDLDKALKYYQKADRLTGEPVEEISQALGRIRVRIGKEKRLEQQLQR